MRKKTKGGASILEKAPFIKNINKKGIYIADDIDYNIRQGKKKDLIKKYEDNLNEAKENVKRAKEEKNRNIEDDKIQNERDRATIEERKLRNNKIQFIIKIIGYIFVYFTNLIYKYVSLFGGFLKNFVNTSIILLKTIGTGIKNLASVGQGVIIKTIILILIIIAVFFGYNAIVHNKDPLSTTNDIISTDKDYSSFLIKTTTPNFFGNFNKSLYNLIPDKYKIQFNSFKNNFNSIIGNDIYDIVGIPREIITKGRNDGIYHIKKKDDNENTYTILKPNDIIIPYSPIPNNDYSKLPENIKKLYSTNNLIIPLEKNVKNVWEYNIDNIRDETDNRTLKERDPKYILPFKKIDINEFKFNKIKAKIFNEDDKRASTILTKMFKYEDNKYIYPF